MPRQKGKTTPERKRKVKWLSRLKEVDNDIEIINKEILKWSGREKRMLPYYEQNLPATYAVDEINKKLTQCFNTLEELIDIREEIETEILTAIEQLEIYEKLCLKYKYILNCNYSDIAKDLHYSVAHVKYIHRQALDNLNIELYINEYE